MAITQKIGACLWFDRQAEQAVDFYLSVFKNSRITRKAYYGKEGHDAHHMPEGMVMVIDFELEGNSFMALNGGPVFTFNEAVSFMISCKDQAEIDYYWEKLGAGGDAAAQQCGWLKDKFGVSWQVVPEAIAEMFAGGVSENTERMMAAMMKMKKLDLQQLTDAYNG